MKQLIFFTLLAVTFGCNKEIQKADLERVKGDFEWHHSHDGLFESIYSSTVSDKYGIRIKSRKKVSFYANSEKVLSLKINRIYQTQNGGTVIILQWTEHLERAIIVEDNSLTFFDWPYGDFYNSFQRID